MLSFNDQCSAVRQLAFVYMYCCTGYVIFCILHTLWLLFKTILLSGDIETNPCPDALDFCTWYLNSITAYDILHLAFVEAYTSVYKYGLIGILETHLDSTINKARLAIDCYAFYKSNHPQNVKRGGVGLYVKNSLPSKFRPDMAVLPECISLEVQIHRKSISLLYFIIVQAKLRARLIHLY